MLEKPGFLLSLILILSIIHYSYGGSIDDKYFCKKNYQKGGNRARIIGGHQARAGKTFLELCQKKILNVCWGAPFLNHRSST